MINDNRKATIVLLTPQLIKKCIVQMSKYFTEQNSSERRVKVELDLSNYGTKSDLKNATGVDTSKFAKTFYFDNSKYIVDEFDIDELKKLPTN